jgi:hypothetical protein
MSLFKIAISSGLPDRSAGFGILQQHQLSGGRRPVYRQDDLQRVAAFLLFSLKTGGGIAVQVQTDVVMAAQNRGRAPG